MSALHVLVEPGLSGSGPVRTAVVLGAVAAVVSAVVGVFTVIRSQSFAGHALTDVATTGGSAAAYLGLGPLVGFLGGGVAGAGAMELVGVQRVRGRDLATGVVLGAATGLSALFLYLDATSTTSTGVTQQVLFGSLFTVDRSEVPAAAVLGAVAVAVVVAVARPLLLSSVSPELAAARGVRVRLVGLLHLAALAVSVGLASLTIGSVLSTALLIGPAATAVRLTRTVAGAVAVACGLGVGATWAGTVLAYDSTDWIRSGRGLPVSSFVVALLVVAYLASGSAVRSRTRRAGVG